MVYRSFQIINSLETAEGQGSNYCISKANGMDHRGRYKKYAVACQITPSQHNL